MDRRMFLKLTGLAAEFPNRRPGSRDRLLLEAGDFSRDRRLVGLEDLGGELSFSVDDDGVGFDPLRVRNGTGLQNIADRLAALGGHLTVIPGHDGGTSLQGRFPVRNLEAAT